MRLFNALTVLPFTLLSGVFAQAQNSTQVLQLAVKELPPCALDCMMTSIAESTCALSDLYCIGLNKDLKKELEKCTKHACTTREALTAKNFSTTIFDTPVRDRTKLVSYIALIAGGVSLLAVIIRVIARIPYFGGVWGNDDWAMLATLIPMIPLTGLSVVLADHGLGKDMWMVPFDSITYVLHIYYFDEMMYIASIAMTKISILLSYLRIFPNPQFRRWVWVSLVLCALYIVALIPVTIFQCTPIALSWDRWDGEHEGKCIDVNGLAWAAAVLNIVLDLITLLLPLKELSKLRMSRGRKAGVLFMFLGGGFVTVVSIIRLRCLVHIANTENVTWDYVEPGYWSTLEVHVGIIFACLPALRSLQVRIFPSSHSSSKYYNQASGPTFPSMHGTMLQTNRSRKDMWQQSQASMLRSRDYYPGDTKGFSHIDDHEARFNNDSELGPGVNNTQICRGSIHTDHVSYVDASSLTALPPTYNPRIKVRKEYSVAVEEVNPDGLSASPPRVSEEDRILQTGSPWSRSRSSSRVRS